ncbi:hypothetical protein [Aquabacterium sp.]|uniref:hypothetical protein n=1 Tax=Aquabacterium sp. TaxID=1872578 RepID=UPI004037A05E
MTTQRIDIDWSQSHPGVHHCPAEAMLELMPELAPILATFPDDPSQFTWDVKVHMLMPQQFPCIPHWHTDNVPRANGIQRFDLCRLDLPMYLWLSNAPLTQFKHGFVQAQKWHRFNQADEHRGVAADDNKWRCFIRASHRDLLPIKAVKNPTEYLRRHSQVYVDADTYQW